MDKQFLSKEKNFISIVVYMNNEEKNIQNFLLIIDKIIHENFEFYEFVLVNDFCEDNTIKKIGEIVDHIYGNIQIINLAWKHGIELAMLSGIDISIGDYIYEFDYTSIDYDIEIVFDLYKKCISGFDVVSASPKEKYKYTNRIFYNYLSKISYRKMKLTTETFRIVSRRCLNRVLDFKETIVYRKALYHYSGFCTSVIYYKVQDNNAIRESNFKLEEKFELAIDILINFSNIGIRITSKLSFIFFIISLCAGIYTMYSYFAGKYIEPGWTTIMLFLSISFTGMFFILTLLSKYMVIVLESLQDRPKYVYKSIDRLSKK